jgi:hypothetical protein
MVPDHMLPHTVTVVDPAEDTDDYGNTTYDYGVAATRTDVRAWLQQDQRSEQLRDGRDPTGEVWLMVTNHESIRSVARIEWSGHPAGAVTFKVDGRPEPAYTPSGFHHTEAQLSITNG